MSCCKVAHMPTHRSFHLALANSSMRSDATGPLAPRTSWPSACMHHSGRASTLAFEIAHPGTAHGKQLLARPEYGMQHSRGQYMNPDLHTPELHSAHTERSTWPNYAQLATTNTACRHCVGAGGSDWRRDQRGAWRTLRHRNQTILN